MTVNSEIVAKKTYYLLPGEALEQHDEETHEAPDAMEQGSIPYVNSFGAGGMQRLIRLGVVGADTLLKDGRKEFRTPVSSLDKILKNPIFLSKSGANKSSFEGFLKLFHAALAQFGDVAKVVMIGSGVAYGAGTDLLLSVLPEVCQEPFKAFPDLFQTKIPSDFDLRIVIEQKGDSRALSPENLKIALEKILNVVYMRTLRYEITFKISQHSKKAFLYTYDELLNLLNGYRTPEKLDSLRILLPDGKHINNIRQTVLKEFLANCGKVHYDPLGCEPFFAEIIFPKLPHEALPVVQFKKCESLSKITDNEKTLEGVSLTLEGAIPVDISCIVLDKTENERFEHQRLGLEFINFLTKGEPVELYGCLQAPFDLAYRIFHWTKSKCDPKDWLAYNAALSQGTPSPGDRDGLRLMDISRAQFNEAKSLRIAFETFNKIENQSKPYKAICLFNAALALGLTPEEQPLFFKGYEKMEGALGTIVGIVASGELTLKAAAALLQIAACMTLLSHDLGTNNPQFRVGLQTHACVPVIVYAFPEGTLMIPLNLEEALAALHQVPQEAMEKLLVAVGGFGASPFNPESPLKQDAALLVNFLSVPLGTMEGPESQFILFTRLLQHFLYPCRATFMPLLKQHGVFLDRGLITPKVIGRLLESHLLFLSEGDQQNLKAMVTAVFSAESFDPHAIIPSLISMDEQEIFDHGIRMITQVPGALTAEQKWTRINELLAQKRLLRALLVMETAMLNGEGSEAEWRKALDTILTRLVSMPNLDLQRKQALLRKAGDLLIWALKKFDGHFDFVEKIEEFTEMCRETQYPDLQASFEPYVVEKKQTVEERALQKAIDGADRSNVLKSIEAVLPFAKNLPVKARAFCLQFLSKCFLNDTQESFKVIFALLNNPLFADLVATDRAPFDELLDQIVLKYKKLQGYFNDILSLAELPCKLSPSVFEYLLGRGISRVENPSRKESLEEARRVHLVLSANKSRESLYLQLLLNLQNYAAESHLIVQLLDEMTAHWQRDLESPATQRQVVHVIKKLIPQNDQFLFDRATSLIESYPNALPEADLWHYAKFLVEKKRLLRGLSFYKILQTRQLGSKEVWKPFLNALIEQVLVSNIEDVARKKKLVLETCSLALAVMNRFEAGLTFVTQSWALRSLCKKYNGNESTKGFDAIAENDRRKEESRQLQLDFDDLLSGDPLPKLKNLLHYEASHSEEMHTLLFAHLRKMHPPKALELIIGIHAAPEFAIVVAKDDFKKEMGVLLNELLQKRSVLSGKLEVVLQALELPYSFSQHLMGLSLEEMINRFDSVSHSGLIPTVQRCFSPLAEVNEWQESYRFFELRCAFRAADPDPAAIKSRIAGLIQCWQTTPKNEGIFAHVELCYHWLFDQKSEDYCDSIELLDQFIEKLSKQQKRKCRPESEALRFALMLFASSEPLVRDKGSACYAKTLETAVFNPADLQQWALCFDRILSQAHDQPAKLASILSETHSSVLALLGAKKPHHTVLHLWISKISDNEDSLPLTGFLIKACKFLNEYERMTVDINFFALFIQMCHEILNRDIPFNERVVLYRWLWTNRIQGLLAGVDFQPITSGFLRAIFTDLIKPGTEFVQLMDEVSEALKTLMSGWKLAVEHVSQRQDIDPRVTEGKMKQFTAIVSAQEHAYNCEAQDEVFTPVSFINFMIYFGFKRFKGEHNAKANDIPDPAVFLAPHIDRLKNIVTRAKKSYQNCILVNTPLVDTNELTFKLITEFFKDQIKYQSDSWEELKLTFWAVTAEQWMKSPHEFYKLITEQIYCTQPRGLSLEHQEFRQWIEVNAISGFLMNNNIATASPELLPIFLEMSILGLFHFKLPISQQSLVMEVLKGMYERMRQPGCIPSANYLANFNRMVIYFAKEDPIYQINFYSLSLIHLNDVDIPIEHQFQTLGFIEDAARISLALNSYTLEQKEAMMQRVMELTVPMITGYTMTPNLPINTRIKLLDILERYTTLNSHEFSLGHLHALVEIGVTDQLTKWDAQFRREMLACENRKQSFEAVWRYFEQLDTITESLWTSNQYELKRSFTAKISELFDLILIYLNDLSETDRLKALHIALAILIASQISVRTLDYYQDLCQKQTRLIPLLGELLKGNFSLETLCQAFAIPAAKFSDDPNHPIVLNLYNFMEFFNSCSVRGVERFVVFVVQTTKQCDKIIIDHRFIKYMPHKLINIPGSLF